MAIEKSLYAAPQGLEELAAMDASSPQIEIEIEDPESVTIGMGDLEIEIEPSKESEDDFNANLAEHIGDDVLQSLAEELIGDYDEDVASRKDWMQTYVDGLELLGMKIEERTEPWEGACGIYHPMLSEALVKFQSETMMATFPAAGPVKTQIIGKETPAKKESAQRVQDDMNYQLTDVMKEYRPEHERMLWGLGLAGNAFKKVYFDPHLDRQVSFFVPAEDIVVPYGASNLESSPRVTHVMRKTENELRRLQVAGFYRDIDLGTPENVLDEVEKKIAEKMGFRATSDNRFKLLEMNVDLDLEGYEHKDEKGEKTGIALPYVVTIEKGSSNVLAIRRNWEPDDETYAKRQHFVHYGYVPGFGFYYFGLIHLIGAFAKSGTSIIRQLVDAGTLSNLPGGFKTRGMRVKGDDTPIAPGEWRDADVASGTLKDNLLPLPYKEPSQVLAGLLDKIVEEGRRFANTADLTLSDMSAQAPVGTTLAILERTLKNMSAIQARVHYSMKQELGLLKNIIAEYTPEDYDYEPSEGSRKAKKSDYDDVDVIPVSDPNASTMAQKIVQYQAVLQLAQGAPQLYNLPLLHRQMLDVLGIKDAQKLVPMDDDQKPTDPVSENQNVLKGKPVKAFISQDHQAHIVVHMAAMQDPKIQALLQQNPMAQAMQSAMMAHINEHLGFEYRKQIEQTLGMQLPPQTDESGEEVHMSPEVEARLSPMLAQAAQQLLQKNQQEAQQKQAQQQAQDPIIQMQMQELQLKAQENQRKAAKDQADNAIKAAQLQIERERIQTQQTTDDKRIKMDAVKMAAQMQDDKQKSMMTMGVDVLKHLSNKSHEEQLRYMQERIQARQQQNRQPKKGE
jgi:predicted nucleic acid-binding protein